MTAVGGKVSGAGAGVESEEGEGVEVGREGVKLLTLGVGKVDKDAVLQAAQAQVDRIKAAREQVVLKVLHIGCRLRRGSIKPPCLGLVEKIIDQMNKFAAGFGNFRNHMEWIFSISVVL